MTDSAIRAAVAADPDDDLPRLVAADWLDDYGHPDHAEFVRAQVRLAASDPWEPFAVYCRHHRPDWVHGQPWRQTLPPVDGFALEWHPDRAFRRGFGWALVVRDVRWLLDQAPRLFAEAPIGELHLPTATLDEWKAFARTEWLPRIKVIHFFGTTTPVEPVRELIASPLATGIEEIVFEKASGAGLPVLLEDLLASPLGRQLKRLELRVGPDQPDELYAVLRQADTPNLKALQLVTFPTTAEGMWDLYDGPNTRRLTELELTNVLDADPPFGWSVQFAPNLLRLRMSNCGCTGYGWIIGAARYLQSLDLSDNSMGDWQLPRRATDQELNGYPSLVSLNLRHTHLSSEVLDHWLTRAAFWANLVELDLRDNRITDEGAEHLLHAPRPPDLTALLLAGNPLSDEMRDRLREHFGDAFVL